VRDDRTGHLVEIDILEHGVLIDPKNLAPYATHAPSPSVTSLRQPET